MACAVSASAATNFFLTLIAFLEADARNDRALDQRARDFKEMFHAKAELR
jgi:hypothetical protein